MGLCGIVRRGVTRIIDKAYNPNVAGGRFSAEK